MSSAIVDFVLSAEGRFAVDAQVFGRMAGVDVGDILAVEGALHIERRGFRLQGRTDAGLGAFGYDEQRWVDVWIPFDGQPGFLTVGGLNRIASMSVRGQLHVTPRRVDVSGRLDVPSIDVTVQASVISEETGARLEGGMSVPSQFTDDVSAAIVAEGQRAAAEVASLYDAYRQATAEYEFELSLRGMRSVIPPFCDAMLSLLSQVQSAAHARIDREWPWYLPGKSEAKRSVTDQINVYRSRFSILKTRVQTGDSESVRAALASAINTVLSNQVVTVRVSVIGTVYSRDVVDGTQESRLRAALAAIAALPATSTRMVSARTIWDQAPKREALISTASAITAGVAGAAPRITRIGFDQPFGQPEMTLFVQVEHQGRTSTIVVPFDPVHPERVGASVGVLFAGAM
jgi:hypothetical protein